MKNFRWLGIAGLLVGSLASAGGVSGGGGKGVVCRDSAGAITSAETLDLYEGRVMYGLNIAKSSDPMNAQIQRALNVIPTTSRATIEFYVELILKSMRITAETKLLPIDDSFEVVLPKNCEAEQLANYFNNNLVLVSGEIWSSLGETDRAALILHEAVYAANRTVGAADSRQSRHVVASIFDSETKWVDVKDQVPKDALNCISSSKGFTLWAYKDRHGAWVLQFQVLGQGIVMSKKSISLYPEEGFDLTEAKTFPVFPEDNRIDSSFGSTMVARSSFEESDVVTVTKSWEAIKDRQGKVIEGFQTPRYYLSWKSGTFPKMSFADQQLNCTLQYH